MSADENNPTTPTQKVLIGLISLVLVLLLGQLITSSSNSLPDDREACLSSGNIWSQSAEECYESQPDNDPVGTESLTLSVGETESANDIQITVQDIVSDDRCPIDAQCVQDGAVTVSVTLKQDGLQEEPNISTDDDPYSFAGRLVSLRQVEPERTAEADISEEDYRLTFWVTSDTS